MRARTVALSTDQTKTIGGNSYLYLGATGRSLPDSVQLSGTGNSVVQLSGTSYTTMSKQEQTCCGKHQILP